MLIKVNFSHFLFCPNLFHCFFPTYFVVFFSWGLGEGMKYFIGNNSVREGHSPFSFLLKASQLSSVCFVSKKTSHRANIYNFQDGQSLRVRTGI